MKYDSVLAYYGNLQLFNCVYYFKSTDSEN